MFDAWPANLRPTQKAKTKVIFIHTHTYQHYKLCWLLLDPILSLQHYKLSLSLSLSLSAVSSAFNRLRALSFLGHPKSHPVSNLLVFGPIFSHRLDVTASSFVQASSLYMKLILSLCEIVITQWTFNLASDWFEVHAGPPNTTISSRLSVVM